MSRNMCSFAAPNPSFNQKSTKDPNFETFYLQIAISTNFTVFVVVSESPRRKSFVLKRILLLPKLGVLFRSFCELGFPRGLCSNRAVWTCLSLVNSTVIDLPFALYSTYESSPSSLGLSTQWQLLSV